MKNALFKYTVLIVSLICTSISEAATCVSTGSGSWTNTATWLCGAVPACGDSVLIQAGHTVSISAHSYTSCGINMVLSIRGTLQFTDPGKLEFSCSGRVLIYAGAQIIASPGATGNQNAIMTCGSTWWNAGAGTYNGPGCMPATLPGCFGILLPVELKSFEAIVCDRHVCISWETASETNNDHFEIQRSGNGLEFYTLQKINSQPAGNSRAGYSYTFEDREPLGNINYYRLKQVDKDGSFRFYKIVAVQIKTTGSLNFSLYPNPNSGEFRVQAAGLRTHVKVGMSIQNALGTVVLEHIITGKENEDDIRIHPEEQLGPGIYFCVFTVDGNAQRVKLVIE